MAGLYSKNYENKHTIIIGPKLFTSYSAELTEKFL